MRNLQQIKDYCGIEHDDEFRLDHYQDDTTLVKVWLNGRFSLSKRELVEIESTVRQLRKALRERDEKYNVS